ncbi:glycoside hydrolase family 15 [Terrabacter carboxydivorans]|uniref:Glycoside hydrolase family 15 n=1 Tax=Terrabacter carboxydivorans TaxID=619730 RepID=A0ABP5YY57_9MICO
MRRVVVGAVAAVVAAGCALAPQLLGRDPLPVLRNDAGWRSRSVLAPASLGDRLVDPVAEAVWLADGTVPASGARSRVAAQALGDLHALTLPNGAVAAGPDGPWAYAWPRDSAFVAAAFAETGHVDDARRVLGFLARVQLPDGGFEARYRLDGSGPPDDRPRQTDGAGWVLWSLDRVRAASADRVLPTALRALRDRAFAFAVAQTDSGRRLPEVSPDYWEVSERRVTLGTAAPPAAGLESASRTYAAEGDTRRAGLAARAASRLRALIRAEFGPDYERHGHSGGLDAAVAMLMPPFAATDDAAAERAWARYPVLALRSAGGLAPGVDWKSDGVSWTPETAMVAYTAAASGHPLVADHWMTWLSHHCTSWGSLPEKVLPDGSPAGPAPLAWTAALVVLTEGELAAHRAGVGDPVVVSVGG